MCCLFGLIDTELRFSGREKTQMMHTLATAAEARGTDASGVAYNSPNGLMVRKSPVAGRKLRFRLRNDTVVAMGHTRMTTKGNEKQNQNNHPFLGQAGKEVFALAHNGVIYNDTELRQMYNLPQTHIETDSYIAVQLIEREHALDFSSLQFASEQVFGSFTFTVLDRKNNLYLVKGDNPLCLIYFPDLGLYLYASTQAILEEGLEAFHKPAWKSVRINLACGEIAKIDRSGEITRSAFGTTNLYWGCPVYRRPLCRRSRAEEDRYIRDLKSVASSFGYDPESVDRLLLCGHEPEEIEAFLYECI